jgi:hypothetical protein
VPPELAAFLAVYAAAVSTGLGVLRVIEFFESRRRIVFGIVLSELIEPGISDEYAEVPAFRRTLLIIRVNNRGPVSVPLSTVSLMLKNKTGLIFNQVAGLPPADKIDPSDSFVLGIEPAQLLKALGPKGEDQVVAVQCHDRAGRTYSKRPSKNDRKQIRLTLEYAEQNPPKP